MKSKNLLLLYKIVSVSRVKESLHSYKQRTVHNGLGVLCTTVILYTEHM